jgi:hypothetical protein
VVKPNLHIVPDPLWKRALRNRKHWDNYQVAANAFELARKLERDRTLDEETRSKKIRDREAAKQRQVKAEKPKRVNSAAIEPLPLLEASPCPRCGKPMVFKPGIARAMHVGPSCNAVGDNVIPFYRHRVTPKRCKTPHCGKVAASETDHCALCASRSRRKVVDTPTKHVDPQDDSAGGSVDGS